MKNIDLGKIKKRILWGLGDWRVGHCQDDAGGRENCQRVGFSNSLITKELEKLGAKIFLGQ